MIVLDILVVLLVTLGVLVALLVLVPITYRAEGAAADDRLRGHARIAWGFGLIAVRVDEVGVTFGLAGIPIVRRRFGDARPAKKARKARKARKPAEAEREPRGRRSLVWLLSRRGLLLAIAGRYLRALHLQGGVDGVVGLASPEDTARLHQALTLADRVLPEGVLDVELDWVEEVVDLEARIKGWLWPLQLIGITLGLWLDRKTWRALRAA